MSIRVLIADDHVIVREGLYSLLEKQSDIEIVGDAEDGLEALELTRKLKPNIVLMDISMPKLNGIDATYKIVREYSNIKVIALSIHSNSMFVTNMIKAGASGYVLKDCLFNELVKAIRTVNDGGVYLSKHAIGLVVDDYLNRLSGTEGLPLESLSDKEHEILQLIGEGKNTTQIAQILDVTTYTIEANRNKILKKLNNQSNSNFVRWAILSGLTSHNSNLR